MAEVAQRFVELLLARDPLGQIELAADFGRGIEQSHPMTALGRHRGTGQPGGAGADHGDGFRRGRPGENQFRFCTGARVDQATGALVLEHVVQASLIAGDAGIDRLHLAVAGLVHPLWICQQRAGHRDHVGVAGGQYGFRHGRHVDAIAGDQRHRDMGPQLGGDAGECRARHRGGNGGNAGFVPADAAVEDRRARGFHGLGLGHDVRPGVAIFDQIQQREAVDHDEIRAAGFAHPLHDFDRKAHPPLGITAPGIVTAIGTRHGELVEQVALGAHDFHAVVTGVLRQPGGGGEVAQGAFDSPCRQGARGERVDRRLQSRRRHRQRVVGITAGMQQLQADLAVVGMHCFGHLSVPAHVPRQGEPTREGLQPADDIGREASGHHQADAAGRALSEIRCELGEVGGAILKAGVHGAHQDSVAQLGEPQVQGRQQMRKMGRHDESIPRRMASVPLPAGQAG